MVSGDTASLVYGIRISSVGPGISIGSETTYDPTGIDLAMKLHYIKGIYFFDSPAYRDLTVPRIKEATFNLFNEYYFTCGRFRRSESGRPYIKCNDCGARFIEAHCGITVDQWLLELQHDSSANKLLVSQLVIGPELHFSPPIYLQYTRFKCGGISIGLSWAHVLGDAFSASNFMNSLFKLIFGGGGVGPINSINTTKPDKPSATTSPPLSIKLVEPVGDHWLVPNNCKMETLSFNLSSTHLSTLQNQSKSDQIPVFESICAILWKSIAKLRESSETNTVTLCKQRQKSNIMGNNQIITTVKTEISVSEADPKELTKILLMADQAEDENGLIEEVVEKENGVDDFVLYGANLTFVKWEEANFYGNGMGFEKARFVYYTVQGVGDEGAVLVLPVSGKEDGNGGERFVTVILPENEITELRSELTEMGLFHLEK